MIVKTSKKPALRDPPSSGVHICAGVLGFFFQLQYSLAILMIRQVAWACSGLRPCNGLTLSNYMQLWCQVVACKSKFRTVASALKPSCVFSPCLLATTEATCASQATPRHSGSFGHSPEPQRPHSGRAHRGLSWHQCVCAALRGKEYSDGCSCWSAKALKSQRSKCCPAWCMLRQATCFHPCAQTAMNWSNSVTVTEVTGSTEY